MPSYHLLDRTENVKFDEGFYQAPIKKTYEEYLDTHKKLYAGRDDKFVCLMDLALLAMKRLKKKGNLQIRKNLTKSMHVPSWYR